MEEKAQVLSELIRRYGKIIYEINVDEIVEDDDYSAEDLLEIAKKFCEQWRY